MSLLQRIDQVAGLFGLTPKRAPVMKTRRDEVPEFWRSIGAAGEWGGAVPDPSVYEAQADRYIKSPAFYAAVNRLAEAGAMAKLAIYDGPGEDAELLPNHPLLALLARPAPNMEWLSLDRFTLLESVLASLVVTGNSFVYLGGRTRPTQPPTMLLPLRTDRITVLPDKKDGVIGYKYEIGHEHWPLPVADVIHLRRWHPLNDFMGLSQVEPANYALATDLAAQKHNWATFKNGARLSVVVESDLEHVNPAEKRLMEQYWLDRYTGDPEKAHQVAFLWAGFKAKDFGMNLRDAEYIEGRKFNRADILMATGIHPALLMAEDVNLANARVAEYLFAKYTLLPALTRIQNRFNSELLPLFGEGHELRFLDVVPRDTQQQLEQHAIYLDRGVMSINEVRRQLGMDEALWGDVPWPALQARLQMGMPVTGLEAAQVVDGEALQVEGPKRLAGGITASAEIQAMLVAAARVLSRDG